MKERPILFSGEMVRAILEGRKTQTRRVLTPLPERDEKRDGYVWRKNGMLLDLEAFNEGLFSEHCPFGEAGDRLWVREAWAVGLCADGLRPSELDAGTWLRDNGGLWYAVGAASPSTPISPRGKWRSPIHMPRWASRVALEIVRVRVERLQNINIADIQAEGIDCGPYTTSHAPATSARVRYYELWNSLNAKRGYPVESNPFVWVIEFKKVESAR